MPCLLDGENRNHDSDERTHQNNEKMPDAQIQCIFGGRVFILVLIFVATMRVSPDTLQEQGKY